MPALGANTACGRRIGPVEVEEGGQGGVQLCAALPETVVPAGVTVQGPAHYCNGCRRIAVRSLHWCISLNLHVFAKCCDRSMARVGELCYATLLSMLIPPRHHN